MPNSLGFGKGNEEPNSLAFFCQLYKMQIIVLKGVSKAQGGFPCLFSIFSDSRECDLPVLTRVKLTASGYIH